MAGETLEIDPVTHVNSSSLIFAVFILLLLEGLGNLHPHPLDSLKFKRALYLPEREHDLAGASRNRYTLCKITYRSHTYVYHRVHG